MKNFMGNFNSLLPRIQPVTQEESIIIAAVVFNINLTECINPHAEYKLLIKFKDRYIPNDEKFRIKYLRNPNWYNVKKTWTEKLNCLYTPEMLLNFLSYEGYKPQGENIDIKLKQIRSNKTFYKGIHPNAENVFTPINFTNINSVNSNYLISYGVIDDILVYTIDEIIECFNMFKSFVLSNYIISKESLNKLILIMEESNSDKYDMLMDIFLYQPKFSYTFPFLIIN